MTYRLVDTLSTPVAAPSPASAAELALVRLIDPGTLERDVRHLAAAEREGRGRGTAGNAAARAFLLSRLRGAGLEPLFDGAFEQPTLARPGDARPYATNVGAWLPGARGDAGWIALAAHYDHLGVRAGRVHPGADDNASSVALLLSLGDALGRARPPFRHGVALVFPDAEEPPDIRTERMGSSWFWRHPPHTLATLSCALVFDLMGGMASDAMRRAGLADLLFVMGAEASPGLAHLARSVPAEPGVDPTLFGLAMIEAYPFLPGRRFARSDYHGLREQGGRPFLFLTAGRTPTYHTPEDTPDTLDYPKLGRFARWVVRLMARAADGVEPLGWTDRLGDPWADARALTRLYGVLGDGRAFPWLLRRALARDRERVAVLSQAWDAGRPPTSTEYRSLQLASLRLQAAIWHPAGWWFALW